MHPYDQNRSANSIYIHSGAGATAVPPEGKSFYKIQSLSGTTATFTELIPATGAVCIGTTGQFGVGGIVGSTGFLTGATSVSSANLDLTLAAGPIYGNWRSIKLAAGHVVAYFA
jgi:hypothetical protein